VDLSTAASPRTLRFRDALFAMLGIGLINMLVALDQTVVSTALPSIVSELHGFEYYAWVASAYLLASVVTVPVFGRLGDFFGRKCFVVAAVIVFSIASLACGLATSMPILVLARGLQGVGGGMMVGTAFASIPDLFPNPRDRLRWQVIMAAAYGIGTSAGPSLGGWLSEHFGWRSTFYVNLPVGTLALYFIWRHLPTFRRPVEGKVQIDWAGALLVAIVLGGLQFAIEVIPDEGFTTRNVLLVSAVLLALTGLIVCERRTSHPIVPLDLFRDPQMVTLFMLSVLAGIVMFSLIFFAPLLLQGGFGLSPQEAGLLATPIAACIALGSLANTRIVIHLPKPTLILTIGFLLLAMAAAGIGLATRNTPHLWLECSMATIGIGLGFILNNLNIFAQEIAGRQRLGIATALLQSTRMVGGIFGTSIVGTIVHHQYQVGVSVILDGTGSTTMNTWRQKLIDPRCLIDPALHDALLAELARGGVDGSGILESARHVLVTSIHIGVALTGCAAVTAAWLVRRVSTITFEKREKLSR
jgi:EmrB/QacA subfamily drug resistance transporter